MKKYLSEKEIKNLSLKKNNIFIIFYIEIKGNNENIQPYNLYNYIKKKIIEIENKNVDFEALINDIIENDIDVFFKKLHQKCGNNNNKNYVFIYKDRELIITEKTQSNFSINAGSVIPIKNSSISLSYNDIDLLLKNLNTIIVKKIKNASYIIASMYSLTYIKSIVVYFFEEKNNKIIENSDLLKLFKDYLFNLVKENVKNEKFVPNNFISYLNQYYVEDFDLKEEKEPIFFIKKILDCIHKRLNNMDNKTKKKIKDFKNEFKNDKQFEQYYLEKFVPNNNSIISDLFYGIFEIKKECCSCGKYKEYKIFNHIDIDINKYSDYNKDNSLIYYYLDDLIDFYFSENQFLEDKDSKNECTKCKRKDIKIEGTIIKFPEILIFRINWGKFDVSEGFDIEYNKLIYEEDKILDLKNYSSNKEKQFEYRIKSAINFPIKNESNKENKAYKKFITFARYFNNNIYCFQPSGDTDQIHHYNRIKFVPFVLFYERLN